MMMLAGLFRRVAATVVVALMVVTMLATAAFAQYPPAPATQNDVQTTVQSSDEDGPTPGSSTTMTFGGLPPNTDVRIVVQVNPVLFDGVVRTNSQGVAQVTFTIPADVTPGTVITADLSGDAVSGTVRQQIVVAASVSAATLADTGFDLMRWSIFGVAGLLAGGLLIGFARRSSKSADRDGAVVGS